MTTTKTTENIQQSISRTARLRGLRKKLPPWAGTIGVALLVGLLGSLFFEGALLFLLTSAVIYSLFAMGTNILFGWTGISSFGQAAYFGVGAYSVGLTNDFFENPLVALLIAVTAAAVIAAGYALIASRITGVEFAMLTLIFGQILWLLTFRVPELRGENGIPGITRGEILGVNLFSESAFWWYTISVVGVAVLGLSIIRTSPFGVALNAVRDDPVRAEALGISVRSMRIWAFILAGSVAGLAGGLFAQHQGLVTPELIVWVLSGKVIVMCLIGGMRTFWGPAIGAVLFIFIEHYLLGATSSPDFYIGIALLVIVLVVPGGLLSIPKHVINYREKNKRRNSV